MKFNYMHFPVGTHVRGNVFPHDPSLAFDGKVIELVKNGVNSYCIILDTPDALFGNKTVNITYVSEIVKRGDGDIKFKKPTYSRKEFLEDVNRMIVGKKHPTQYNGYYGFRNIIVDIAERYVMIDGCLDVDKLVDKVYATNAVKIRSGECDFNSAHKSHVINKKKLKSIIRRLVPKCLMKLKVAEKEEAARFDDDLGYDDERHGHGRYETTNKHGHLQMCDEDGVEICSQCGCCYVNFGEGTMCGECRYAFDIECEHDYHDFY